VSCREDPAWQRIVDTLTASLVHRSNRRKALEFTGLSGPTCRRDELEGRAAFAHPKTGRPETLGVPFAVILYNNTWFSACICTNEPNLWASRKKAMHSFYHLILSGLGLACGSQSWPWLKVIAYCPRTCDTNGFCQANWEQRSMC